MLYIPEDIVITSSALKHSGGAERYTRDLIRGLHELGIRPTLYAREIDDSLIESSWVISKRLSVRWAPPKLRAMVYDWVFNREMSRARPRCVLSINCTTSSDIAVCVGTHCGWLRASRRSWRWNDRRQIELEKSTYASARAIVAHSNLMAHELKVLYGVPEEKIRVMYPPVDPVRFSPLTNAERARVRDELNLPHDRVLFFFSSTSHFRKGYELIRTYFEQTSLPICLVVAGRPVRESAKTIRCVGYRRDIERLFAAVDFTLVPSVYEPFGYVAIESVMCGTPIIVADNVGAAEVVSPNAKFTFTREIDATFAAAVEAAIEQARVGDVRVRQPRASVLYDPSIEKHVAELNTVMQQLQLNK
ncbi:glycosyltransferase family 4 protein [Caballeronia sp. LZ043]|uniref:glycosyltransferase family 4 protein n=1 Tax=Caballeronia sp. LZ043 TaxID=3038569 RepID=UPI0028642214|nr:glycosyltransferase family 4 protein [Caballeronia sp. LZ043]MDR5823616.1 glycosyltransferase family 4 protein [Caballeronia sp. LZ043]